MKALEEKYWSNRVLVDHWKYHWDNHQGRLSNNSCGGSTLIVSGASLHGRCGDVEVLGGSSNSDFGGSLKLSGGTSTLDEACHAQMNAGASDFGLGGVDAKIDADNGEMIGGSLILDSGSSTHSSSLIITAGDSNGGNESDSGGSTLVITSGSSFDFNSDSMSLTSAYDRISGRRCARSIWIILVVWADR